MDKFPKYEDLSEEIKEQLARMAYDCIKFKYKQMNGLCQEMVSNDLLKTVRSDTQPLTDELRQSIERVLNRDN